MRATTTLAIQSEPVPDEDSELILAAQKNSSLFQAIYDRWAVRVYQYFYHRTGEMTSAEDLTSQLFFAAYQALPRYQHRGHFAAWLFTIARNLVKEHYRKQRREVPLDMARHMMSPSELAVPTDPAEEYAHSDEIRQLVQLVRSLPEEERELIRLRYVANLSFADMAIVLTRREDAVKKSLYRLQARLQSLLEQNHD
ncbi:MAG: RNA polymerase sigma factor [Anaerolineales bacterium]|nr:RNA polymerase sigma factor [Anaerolineales bacterium]